MGYKHIINYVVISFSMIELIILKNIILIILENTTLLYINLYILFKRSIDFDSKK